MVLAQAMLALRKSSRIGRLFVLGSQRDLWAHRTLIGRENSEPVMFDFGLLCALCAFPSRSERDALCLIAQQASESDFVVERVECAHIGRAST